MKQTEMAQSTDMDGASTDSTSISSVVYIVDDEPVIATTLAAILNRRGFEALAFTNPLDALKSIETRRADALISDVMMPEMNGIELAIRVRASLPSCRIVLFSGQAATSDMLEEARRDGYDFTLLLKPVHPSDLLAAIGPVALRADS
jgi:CheY-like chemotaxis protein